MVYLCVWCGGVLAFAWAHQNAPAVVFVVLILPLGLALGYRAVRLSVTCYDDYLLVRNHVRTYRVPRSEIEGFRIGRKVHQSRTLTIYARLRDGTVLPFDVAAWHLFYFGRGMTLKDQLRLLEAWLGSC